jgi:acetolactate synthase-1/2/3 large subunit
VSAVRGADVLARTLAAAGTRYVFALSGNHVMPVFDAALDAGLELVHVRHEAAAVHMADAWGRLTGEPGIALVTGGPGHANALGALYTALAAQSPLVLISGHAPLAELGRGAFQEMAQADLAAPLTKLSRTVQSAQSLGAELARALREARLAPAGPVHLSVPSDVLDARLEGAVAPASDLALREPASDAREAESLLEVLERAERPLIVCGPGVGHARGRVRLEEFEAQSGVPVIVMESPRGVNDPALGRLAGLLARADLAVLAGKRRDFTLGFGAAFGAGCRFLEVPPALVSRLRAGRRLNSGAWLDEARAALAWRPPQWAEIRSAAEGPAHPLEVCRAAQALLSGPDAVLVCDGGEFGQWAQACMQAPQRVINGPAGSIGSALPFAAAAKLAFPAAPVLAMLGDGTFGFHMSELDTAVRRGLGYVAVIGNDACWNAEYQIALRTYGAERARGLDLLPTRYGAVAAALGAHGEDVPSAAQLEGALARAVQSGKPACVNAMIERAAAPRY